MTRPRFQRDLTFRSSSASNQKVQRIGARSPVALPFTAVRLWFHGITTRFANRHAAKEPARTPENGKNLVRRGKRGHCHFLQGRLGESHDEGRLPRPYLESGRYRASQHSERSVVRGLTRLRLALPVLGHGCYRSAAPCVTSSLPASFSRPGGSYTKTRPISHVCATLSCSAPVRRGRPISCRSTRLDSDTIGNSSLVQEPSEKVGLTDSQLRERRALFSPTGSRSSLNSRQPWRNEVKGIASTRLPEWGRNSPRIGGLLPRHPTSGPVSCALPVRPAHRMSSDVSLTSLERSTTSYLVDRSDRTLGARYPR